MPIASVVQYAHESTNAVIVQWYYTIAITDLKMTHFVQLVELYKYWCNGGPQLYSSVLVVVEFGS